MNRHFVVPALALVFAGSNRLVVANLVSNGDFSANATLYTTFPGYDGNGANPANPTSWTTNGTYHGVDGADANTTVFGPSNLSGVTDFLFLQNAPGTGNVASSASQNITFAPNTDYSLTFSAGSRNSDGYVPFGVTVNDGSSNVTSSTTYAAVNNQFHRYVVNFRTGASAGAGSITFANTSGTVNDRTADFSNVVLAASGVPIVKNSGFEAQNLGGPNGNFAEGSTAEQWTHIAGSDSHFGGGIVGNGSAYGNLDAPEGVQAGLLKGDGGMSQTVDGFAIGQIYTIGFWAEGRTCCGNADPLNIQVGSTTVKFGGLTTLTPVNGSYNYYTSDPFTVTANSNLLQILGTTTFDSATFIDDIQFLPEPASLSLLSLSSLALLARRRQV